MSGLWSRYAPSPTGPLHLGNLQTALAAFLQARLDGAGFILRIEDLDLNRCRPEFTESIIADLQRLDIDWDVGPGRSAPVDHLQSARQTYYRATLDHLNEARRLYPCTCTRRELAGLASAPHGPLGRVYPGICRQRTMPEVAEWTDGGTVDQAVRFRVEGEKAVFEDEVCGPVHCDVANEVGDFVVFRRDGVFAYHLAVVVDDIAAGVTDVLRGDDLLWSVFPQLELYGALDAAPPRYWHVPLRLDEDGERMSKRFGGITLSMMLEAGHSVEDVIGMLAFDLGLIDRAEAVSVNDLRSNLDADAFARLIRAKRASVGAILG